MCKNSQFGSGQGNHSFENDFPVNKRNNKSETIDNHNLNFGRTRQSLFWKWLPW